MQGTRLPPRAGSSGAGGGRAGEREALLLRLDRLLLLLRRSARPEAGAPLRGSHARAEDGWHREGSKLERSLPSSRQDFRGRRREPQGCPSRCSHRRWLHKGGVRSCRRRGSRESRLTCSPRCLGTCRSSRSRHNISSSHTFEYTRSARSLTRPFPRAHASPRARAAQRSSGWRWRWRWALPACIGSSHENSPASIDASCGTTAWPPMSSASSAWHSFANSSYSMRPSWSVSATLSISWPTCSSGCLHEGSRRAVRGRQEGGKRAVGARRVEP